VRSATSHRSLTEGDRYIPTRVHPTTTQSDNPTLATSTPDTRSLHPPRALFPDYDIRTTGRDMLTTSPRARPLPQRHSARYIPAHDTRTLASNTPRHPNAGWTY